MILDHCQHAGIYQLGSAWTEVWNQLELFLKEAFPQPGEVRIEEGTYPLDDDCSVRVFKASLRSQALYESHRKMVDLQIPLEHMEYMHMHNLPGVVQLDKDKDFSSVPGALRYDEEKDLCLHPAQPEAEQVFMVLPGMFALFWPHEAHRPAMLGPLCQHQESLKMVVKIPMNRLTLPKV